MIGNHQYEVDFIKAEESTDYTTSNYVVLRKFELINDLPNDTDFYIVSKDKLNKWKKDEYEIVWPYIGSNSLPIQTSNPSNFLSDLYKTVIKTKESDIIDANYYLHISFTKYNPVDGKYEYLSQINEYIDDVRTTLQTYYIFIELGVSIDNGKTIWWNTDASDNTKGYTSILSDIITKDDIKLTSSSNIQYTIGDLTNKNYFPIEITIPENNSRVNKNFSESLSYIDIENISGHQESLSFYLNNSYSLSGTSYEGSGFYYHKYTSKREIDIQLSIDDSIIKERGYEIYQSSEDYNQYLLKKTVKTVDTNVDEFIYNIYDSNISGLLNIKEDTIRIWHPQTKVTIDATIYIHTVINNKRFHLLGEVISPKNSSGLSKEWRKGHGIYSEYIDFKIPSLTHLFGQGYWNDDLSNIELDDSLIDKKLIYKEELEVPKVIYYLHSTLIQYNIEKNTYKPVNGITIKYDNGLEQVIGEYYLYIEIGLSVDGGQTIWWNKEASIDTNGYNSVLENYIGKENIVVSIENAQNVKVDIDDNNKEYYTGWYNDERLKLIKLTIDIPQNDVLSNKDGIEKIMFTGLKNIKGNEFNPASYNEDDESVSSVKKVSDEDYNNGIFIGSTTKRRTIGIQLNIEFPKDKLNDGILDNGTVYEQEKEYNPERIIVKELNEQEYQLLKDSVKDECIYNDIIKKWKLNYKFLDLKENTKIYSPFVLNIHPYKISEENNIFSKVYLPRTLDMKSWNMIVSISPYDYIDETTNIYYHKETNDGLEIGNVIFTDESKFHLKADFGFIDGEISIIGNWYWPENLGYDTFKEAYEYINDVKFSNYTKFDNKVVDEDDDIDEEEKTQTYCAFKCEISSDNNMKYIIWSKYYDGTEPDDFSIGLREVFDNWNEVPEVICIRLSFIDKLVGCVFSSPIKVILKEKIKYMINDISKNRLSSLVNKQELNNKYNLSWLFKKYNKDVEMDLSYFNFIDNIRCTIKDNSKTNISKMSSNQLKVLYKPIFYRVQDLQSIKIHKNLVQNIGINLSNIMTKVETFSIRIGDNTYKESSRNDVYTIFKINGSDLSSLSSGIYHILNEDAEYISSGTYTIIE